MAEAVKNERWDDAKVLSQAREAAKRQERRYCKCGTPKSRQASHCRLCWRMARSKPRIDGPEAIPIKVVKPKSIVVKKPYKRDREKANAWQREWRRKMYLNNPVWREKEKARNLSYYHVNKTNQLTA